MCCSRLARRPCRYRAVEAGTAAVRPDRRLVAARTGSTAIEQTAEEVNGMPTVSEDTLLAAEVGSMAMPGNDDDGTRKGFRPPLRAGAGAADAGKRSSDADHVAHHSGTRRRCQTMTAPQ